MKTNRKLPERETHWTAPIDAQIADIMRRLDATAMANLRKGARMHRCTVESMVWCLVKLYPSGATRSAAWADVPIHVRNDGLVTEHPIEGMGYLPWKFTPKGQAIVDAAKNA